VGKKILWVTFAAAVVAGGLVSCSDDEWDVELFLWPPLERTVPNGEIEIYPAEEGGVAKVVVRLRGSRYDVGYAHGQLLGSQIIVLLTNCLVKELGPAEYERVRGEIDAAFEWPAEAELELQGMVDGMRDEGRNLWVEELDRELGVADLKVWNAYPDHEDFNSLPGGQVFALWGEASGYKTPLGARNFELYPGAERYLKSTWPAIAYEAEGLPFVSVAPPGYIGVLTGVSRVGVSVFANRGDGERGGEDGRPLGLLLREFLTSNDQPALADLNLLNLTRGENRYGSWNLLVVTSMRFTSRPAYPEFACVVECDKNKAVVRYAGSVRPENYHDRIFATNTHRLLKKPAGADPEYDRLVSRVNDVVKKGDFTETQAVDILKEVSGPDNVHSLIHYVNRDGMFVMLAVSDGEGRAAETGDYRYFALKDFWPE
jgi:hypothetical protein